MIKLFYDNNIRRADLVRNGGNIQTDDTFETSAMISLFTRRRALPDDVLPEPFSHKEGWWADSYPDVDGDLIGSRLWLLSRSKTTQTVLNLAAVYSKEALQWYLDDGIALDVDVEVERHAEGVLAFKPMITRVSDPSRRWERFWTAHLALL